MGNLPACLILRDAGVASPQVAPFNTWRPLALH